MANAISIAEMKQRVAATEAILSTAAQEGQQRKARLLNFLETVEQNLVQNQQQISDLEEEQSRSRGEIQLLRNMLHNVLTMAENTLECGPRLGSDDLEQLIGRLDAITPVMNQDAEKGAGGDCAKEPDTPPVRKRRASKVLAFFGAPRA